MAPLFLWHRMGALTASQAVVRTLVVAAMVTAVANTAIRSAVAPVAPQPPDFSITDIDGQNITLSGLRGKVVVLDFMYISCEGCKIVTDNLQQIIPSHGTDLVIISIDIIPSETDTALQSYRTSEGITWQVARDTDSVASKFGVGATLPHVIIVDRCGAAAWNWKVVGPINPGTQKSEMQAAISAALSSFGCPTPGGQTDNALLIVLAVLVPLLVVTIVAVVLVTMRRRKKLR